MEIIPRAAGIVPKGGSLVLVKHEKDGNEYWVPPGGKIEPGEKIKEAVEREVKEETNLNVDVKDILYYQDFIRAEEHRLGFFFLCKIKNGKLRLGEDPEDQRKNPILTDVKYASLEDIREMNILPKTLKARIIKDLPDKFDVGSPIYLNEMDL